MKENLLERQKKAKEQKQKSDIAIKFEKLKRTNSTLITQRDQGQF